MPLVYQLHGIMTRAQVADGEEGLRIWRLAADVFNKQSRTADKWWSSSLVVGCGLTTPRCKKIMCYEMFHG